MEKLGIHTAAGVALGVTYGMCMSAWNLPGGPPDGVYTKKIPVYPPVFKNAGTGAVMFGGMFAFYTIGESSMAAMRGQSDIWTAMAGGACGGLVVATRASRYTRGFGTVLFFAGLTGLLHICDGQVMMDHEKLKKRFETVRESPRKLQEQKKQEREASS